MAPAKEIIVNLSRSTKTNRREACVFLFWVAFCGASVMSATCSCRLQAKEPEIRPAARAESVGFRPIALCKGGNGGVYRCADCKAPEWNDDQGMDEGGMARKTADPDAGLSRSGGTEFGRGAAVEVSAAGFRRRGAAAEESAGAGGVRARRSFCRAATAPKALPSSVPTTSATPSG